MHNGVAALNGRPKTLRLKEIAHDDFSSEALNRCETA